MKALDLPENERRYAVMLAQWEAEIADNAAYIMGTSIRHPSCDMRVAARSIELAETRKMILDLHPKVKIILPEVREILENRK